MGTGHRTAWRVTLVQAGAVAVAATLVLTSCFLGALALVSGRTAGIEERLPFYALALGIAFVGAVVAFEGEFGDGRDVLGATVLTSTATAAVVFFAGEGIAFAAADPDRLVASQLLFYLLAAGLIAIGIAYWVQAHVLDPVGGRRGR